MLRTFDRIVWKFGSIRALAALRPGTPTKNRLALSLPVVRVGFGAVLMIAWTFAVVGWVASKLKVHGPLANGTVGEFGSSAEKLPDWTDGRILAIFVGLAKLKILRPDGSAMLYTTTREWVSTTALAPPAAGSPQARAKRERHPSVSRFAMSFISAQPAGVCDRASAVIPRICD